MPCASCKGRIEAGDSKARVDYKKPRIKGGFEKLSELEISMPNPKRRHSQRRTSIRRAHDHLSAPALSECSNCHERKMPHHVCPRCGHYDNREIVETKEAS
jgi:large subunit ribosomal protein L32